MSYADYKLLVVDDELIMREYLGDVLSEMGFNIVKVASGEEAIDKIDGERFDMVITDLKMPGIGGAKVFKHTRLCQPEAKIIIMTAYSLDLSGKQYIEEGAFGFILKPFDLSQIRKLVCSAF